MHWLLPFSTQLQVKKPELLLHTYGREHRVALIIGAGTWHAPERHQAITVKLIDVAPMGIDDFLHNGKVAVELGHDPSRGHLFTHGRETDNIRQQNGPLVGIPTQGGRDFARHQHIH